LLGIIGCSVIALPTVSASGWANLGSVKVSTGAKHATVSMTETKDLPEAQITFTNTVHIQVNIHIFAVNAQHFEAKLNCRRLFAPA
jgi:hypothetical protein